MTITKLETKNVHFENQLTRVGDGVELA